MGKHTQNCTLIGKGVYGTIGVDQRSRLADGAHFHTMIVTSTLEASVIEGDKLVIKSGIVRCDGDIRVSSISGSGDIEVGGDIICDEITFTGKLRCFLVLIWMGMRMAARFAISQPSRLKPTICNARL